MITRRRLLATGGALGLGLAGMAGCGVESETSESGASEGVKLDEETRNKLDTIFRLQFEGTGVAGLAGVVRIGSQTWKASAGFSDLTSKAEFEADDFVRIASITKTFTATAVLQLVDAGQVALTDVLEKYVPGVINGKVATIADVLGMRSGIPDFTANLELIEKFSAKPTLAWSDEDTLKVIAEAGKPDFKPGAKVAYCDSNYALLGMVIKKVTGQPAGTVITEKVIKPLGLSGTSYPTETTIPQPHPTGYVPDVEDPNAKFDNVKKPPQVVNDLNPALPSTAGAMISTLEDLQKWGTELVTGTLLKPETQRRRLETRQFTGQKINFGYGLGITNLNEFLGHDGAILGFSSVVMTRPQTDTQFAFIANESTNFTTPTLTVVLNMIQELYPDQVK